MLAIDRSIFVNYVPKLLLSLFCAHALLQIGDTDGNLRKPLDLRNRKAAVFIFIAVDCPISNSYAPEVNRIISDQANAGFDFYIVYSDPKLSAEDAKKHAKAFGYTCPALLDHDQILMKKFKATVTPQVAVVNGHSDLLYTGRIDDWYADFGKQRYAATTHDLRDALAAINAGKKVEVPVTKAVGCPI